MEGIILQPFTEIGYLQARRFFKLRQINQTLVRTPLVLVGEPDIVVRSQPLGDIVGIEECDPRDFSEAFAAQHLDVCPRDGVDRGGTKGCARDGLDRR